MVCLSLFGIAFLEEPVVGSRLVAPHIMTVGQEAVESILYFVVGEVERDGVAFHFRAMAVIYVG